MQGDAAILHLDGIDDSAGIVAGAVDTADGFANEITSGADAVLEDHGAQVCLERIGRFELPDLADLLEDFLVAGGLGGILILQLSDHHLDEIRWLEAGPTAGG